MARRWSPETCLREPSGDDAASGAGFVILGPLGDAMDLGLPDGPGTHDLVMSNSRALSLKRGCSPPKEPSSNTPATSPMMTASTPAVSASAQVSPGYLVWMGIRG